MQTFKSKCLLTLDTHQVPGWVLGMGDSQTDKQAFPCPLVVFSVVSHNYSVVLSIKKWEGQEETPDLFSGFRKEGLQGEEP